jgi:hypothetical protein
VANFKPIDPSEFTKRSSRGESQRGEVAAPLINEFIESGLPSAELDVAAQSQSHATLASNIRAYLTRHPELGVRMTTVAPDRGEDGKPVKGTGQIKLGLEEVVGKAKPRKPRTPKNEQAAPESAEAEDATDLFDQMAEV